MEIETKDDQNIPYWVLSLDPIFAVGLRGRETLTLEQREAPLAHRSLLPGVYLAVL